MVDPRNVDPRNPYDTGYLDERTADELFDEIRPLLADPDESTFYSPLNGNMRDHEAGQIMHMTGKHPRDSLAHPFIELYFRLTDEAQKEVFHAFQVMTAAKHPIDGCDEPIWISMDWAEMAIDGTIQLNLNLERIPSKWRGGPHKLVKSKGDPQSNGAEA